MKSSAFLVAPREILQSAGAQQDVSRYIQALPGAVIGTNELDKVVALCEGLTPKDAPETPYLYHDLTPRVRTTPRHFAYMKIAEGCDHPCTFCVIPQYRGAFRSRRFESVVNEAKRLFAQGIREINLIGQDTTCYGEDLGIKDGLATLTLSGANTYTGKTTLNKGRVNISAANNLGDVSAGFAAANSVFHCLSKSRRARCWLCDTFFGGVR